MIRIYGKKACPKCEAAKAKLELMGFQYCFYDITEAFDGWRSTLATEARAQYEDTVDSKPQEALPLLEVGNVIYTYPQAMRLLKSQKVDKKLDQGAH